MASNPLLQFMWLVPSLCFAPLADEHTGYNTNTCLLADLVSRHTVHVVGIQPLFIPVIDVMVRMGGTVRPPC